MTENSLYVDKWYAANTEFEDIVFGDQLRDGMIVLAENEMLRVDMDAIRNDWDRARADEFNRWCEVTRLRVIPGHYGPLVKFVGVYPDGSMRVRTVLAEYGWIVKRLAG